MTSPLSPEAVAQMVADRKWPVGGYAPGKYMCICSQCGEHHHADKRASVCADCTIQYLAAENATLRAELAAAEANINIKADWIDATINDMERVEKALETAKTRHIGDQPSYSSASDLGWAHQEYASLRRDIIAALTPTADRTEYERKVAQMKEDFPNGI